MLCVKLLNMFELGYEFGWGGGIWILDIYILNVVCY